MDWREILTQLEARLEELSGQGARFLSVAPDAALAAWAEEAGAAAAPAPADGVSQPAAGAPGAPPASAPRARSAADVTSRLRGEAQPGPTTAAPPPPPQEKPAPAGELLAPQGSEELEALAHQYRACMSCGLGQTRNRLVFGVGHPHPRIAFVGEGPGAEEDQQGLPFVGRAGALLTGLIKALGLTREDVYITNVVKCRPPGNRNPQPDEVAACRPILQRQLELLNPRLVVTLGNVPLKVFKPSAAGITRERGRAFTFGTLRVLPTFHPSYLLRNPAAIETCWKDFKLAFDLAYAPEPG